MDLNTFESMRAKLGFSAPPKPVVAGIAVLVVLLLPPTRALFF